MRRSSEDQEEVTDLKDQRETLRRNAAKERKDKERRKKLEELKVCLLTREERKDLKKDIMVVQKSTASSPSLDLSSVFGEL